ncbi:hypothetical protein GCM10017566_36070 [Amycolatopsis bartoniae]|uniref:Uncharacterized protein n=1 Tax=Amycolatopsis bartoniae TaxID=941986 RepID=A0A8H9MBZ3_9PSEU|nr:hypothetical protein GCM10017566_36070 [Amycolatopsis bartoniae]
MLSARWDAGNAPPGTETGARIAVDTAEATCSGTSIPAGPSKWIQPSPSAGNNPRIRATSNAMETPYGGVISLRVRGWTMGHLTAVIRLVSNVQPSPWMER